jgi:hypothetical protein
MGRWVRSRAVPGPRSCGRSEEQASRQKPARGDTPEDRFGPLDPQGPLRARMASSANPTHRWFEIAGMSHRVSRVNPELFHSALGGLPFGRPHLGDAAGLRIAGRVEEGADDLLGAGDGLAKATWGDVGDRHHGRVRQRAGDQGTEGGRGLPVVLGVDHQGRNLAINRDARHLIGFEVAAALAAAVLLAVSLVEHAETPGRLRQTVPGPGVLVERLRLELTVEEGLGIQGEAALADRLEQLVGD